MAKISIELGTEARLATLYSYPNDPSSTESLETTILHWFCCTLLRDGFAVAEDILTSAAVKVSPDVAASQGYGDAAVVTPSIRVANGQYTLDLESTPETQAELRGYVTCLPQFLEHGAAAHEIVEDLQHPGGVVSDAERADREKLDKPTGPELWDPQRTGKWRFFLPHGMAMLRQTTVNFFHYPPMRLLDTMRDYLDDPVPVRLIEMMIANGVTDEREAWLYSTVMDGAPIAAPDDQGTQYDHVAGTKQGKAVHLVPISHFHAYQDAQTKLLLTSTCAGTDTHTVPIIVYGGPARETFSELYMPGEPLGTLRPRTVEIVPGKQTAVIACGHPYSFYAGAQIGDKTEVGCGFILPGQCARAAGSMTRDLIVVGWQVLMAKNPDRDPDDAFREAADRWQTGSGEPKRRATQCALVRHQGSLLYPNTGNPDPKVALQFTFRLSMDQAAALCAASGNKPCDSSADA